MLAVEYDPIQRMTTTRVLIKAYMKPDELERATAMIEKYKKAWQNTKNCE